MKVLSVPIDRIEIVADRDHRGEGVDLKDLLESIPTIGMLHPLLVLPERNGKYELLAGHRRLRAARQLGCTEVRVQVITLDELRTELATIHENVARKNLPPTEEGRQLARAKAIYEELHPETRHGGKRQRGSSGHNGNLKKAKGFVKATAEATGRSARAISREIKVAEAGATVLQAAVDAGKVKIAQAERIAGLPPEQQGAEVAKIIAQNAQTNSNEKPLKQVVVAGVIDQTAQGKGDQNLTVKATITDLNTRTMRDEQPTPTSASSVIPPVAQSPVALGELLLTAAVQFHASIKGDVISEPERVLELVQRVRHILSQVTMAVREKCPLKSATSA